MKRSQINSSILQAKEMMKEYHWVLPTWAYWSVQDYKNNPKIRDYLKLHQMGWDVTDFGWGNFDQQGIALFCIRNGVQGDINDKPYAEKLLFMKDGQEIPNKAQKVKLEDIINRGGGDLVLEFLEVDENKKELSNDITVLVDGQEVIVKPHQPLVLKRGQSVTINRNVYHKFCAARNSGMVMAGEVSQVNDDNSDNYFLQSVGRFSTIEEDEEPIHPLWNEI